MKKIIFSTLLLVVMGVFAFSTGGAENNTNEQILIYGKAGDAVGLDPARETDGESYTVSEAIFESLLGFVPGTTEIEPALAESWTYADDALSITFNLRKNVKFHDGTDFNADAVMFNIMRQFDENHEYNQYGPWKYWGYMSFNSLIKDIVKIDDYTVRIDLLRKDASIISTMAMDFLGMASPTAIKKYKGDFTNNPVGTGPFKFVSWTKGDTIVLESNKAYWRGSPQLDKVIFKVIPEPTSRALALENGEIDIFLYPSPDDLPRLDKNKDIVLYEKAGLNLGYLAFNTQKKPFDDVRVRRALNMAINRDAIIKATYGELGQALYAPLPPIMWAYNPDMTKTTYNPEKAKALLAEAGYPNGFEAEMMPLPVSRPYMPQGKKVAEIVQQQFAEIGITANIQVYEWGTHLERTDQGEHEMAFLGWTGDNGDPDNFLGVLLAADRAVVPASNIAFWKDTKFSALIKEAVESTDINKRKELYFQAQEVFAKELPWAVIANSKTVIPMNKRVKGFQYTPVGGKSNLYYVHIE